jgi:cystathionine beta-lyase
LKIVEAKSKREIIDHFMIRGEVFILGQEIDWKIEFDGLDNECVLFVGYLDDIPVSAARLCGKKVGRVATKKEYRSQGFGRLMMTFIEEYAKENNINELVLNAQYSVLSFYQSLEYQVVGDIFYEAGIKHIKMRKKIK